MANTYTQIHIHVVFAVRNRKMLIMQDIEQEVHSYITSIVMNQGHKVLQINGMPDHIHLLIGLRPFQSLSELIQIVKRDSSKWINKQRITRLKFNWQEGFGAFACSKSVVPKVIAYIQNQKEHHKKVDFKNEYIQFLEKNDIDYDERYIF